MVTTQKVMEKLAGKEAVEALTEMMAANFEDFAGVQKRYTDAMKTLEESAALSVKDEMEAIQRQTASDLLFSGLLGLKANLDNFIDPMTRNFLHVDFEVYLRETTARSLPEYESAQRVRDRFCASLSAKQKQTYEAVTEYVSYLQTVGPKLAHYYGYIIGNELLRWVIPGYHPDMSLTVQYKMMLNQYLGRDFLKGECSA